MQGRRNDLHAPPHPDKLFRGPSEIFLNILLLGKRTLTHYGARANDPIVYTAVVITYLFLFVPD